MSHEILVQGLNYGFVSHRSLSVNDPKEDEFYSSIIIYPLNILFPLQINRLAPCLEGTPLQNHQRNCERKHQTNAYYSQN